MPYSSNATSDYPKLPSLLSYCKSKGTEAERGIAYVTTVWFPNQWPSLSLDTEKYRLRIPAQGADATELLDFIETAIDQEKVLFVRIDNAKDFSYTLDTLENETGTWEHLGDYGRRCTVDDKKSAPRSRSARTVKKT